MEQTKGTSAREAIVDAASQLFASRAYNAVTVREIAKTADVNPGLIHYYFGGKEGVFQAVISAAVDLEGLVARFRTIDVADMGAELVTAAEAAWGSPGAAGWMSMMRRMLAERPKQTRAFVEKVNLNALLEILPESLDHRALRAQLVVTQMLGLAVMRHVAGGGALAALSVEQVVAVAGPVLQHYLTDELDI